jgi:hypothetical protein
MTSTIGVTLILEFTFPPSSRFEIPITYAPSGCAVFCYIPHPLVLVSLDLSGRHRYGRRRDFKEM